jgi:hypothetical protein
MSIPQWYVDMAMAWGSPTPDPGKPRRTATSAKTDTPRASAFFGGLATSAVLEAHDWPMAWDNSPLKDLEEKQPGLPLQNQSLAALVFTPFAMQPLKTEPPTES